MYNIIYKIYVCIYSTRSWVRIPLRSTFYMESKNLTSIWIPYIFIYILYIYIYIYNFIILEKMRSCLWKLELGFWTPALISPLPKALVPNYYKPVFRTQTSNIAALRSIYFMSKFCMKFFHKVLHETSTYFQILCHFSKL